MRLIKVRHFSYWNSDVISVRFIPPSAIALLVQFLAGHDHILKRFASGNKTFNIIFFRAVDAFGRPLRSGDDSDCQNVLSLLNVRAKPAMSVIYFHVNAVPTILLQGARVLLLDRRSFLTMEQGLKQYYVSCFELGPGIWQVGSRDVIFGCIKFGAGVGQISERVWRHTSSRHVHASRYRPFNLTWLHPVCETWRYAEPIKCKRMQFAMGVAKYEPLSAKSSSNNLVTLWKSPNESDQSTHIGLNHPAGLVSHEVLSDYDQPTAQSPQKEVAEPLRKRSRLADRQDW